MTHGFVSISFMNNGYLVRKTQTRARQCDCLIALYSYFPSLLCFLSFTNILTHFYFFNRIDKVRKSQATIKFINWLFPRKFDENVRVYSNIKTGNINHVLQKSFVVCFFSPPFVIWRKNITFLRNSSYSRKENTTRIPASLIRETNCWIPPMWPSRNNMAFACFL